MSKQHIRGLLTSCLALSAAIVLAAPAAGQAVYTFTASLEPTVVVPGQDVTVTVAGEWGHGCTPVFRELTHSVRQHPPEPPVWRVTFSGCGGGPSAVTPFRESFTFQPTLGGVYQFAEGPNTVEVYLWDSIPEVPPWKIATLSFALVTEAGALQLRGGRFEATATWKDFSGRTGTAHPLPGATPVSGQLWFFSRENPELTVKILDGCLVNGRYWVLTAGATSVEYHLRVTDTQTGTTWTSDNALGQYSQAGADSWAFVCD